MDVAVEMPEIGPLVGRIRADGRLTGIYPAFTVGLVPGSRTADTNFYACPSRGRIRLQADVIVNRIVKTLLAPEVSLRRLN